jgi:hypothetical protein
VVRNYLEALERSRPRRGPRRTVEKLQARLERIEHEIEGAGIFDRLALHQEKLSTEKELAELAQGHDLAALEREFVTIAATYSRRRQISLQAWLAIGVPRNVLNEAGIRE